MRRDRVRSGFIWLMICLPVAALCVVQVVMGSGQIAPAEFLELRLGHGSARLTWTGLRFEPDIDPYRQAVMVSELDNPLAEPALPIPGWGASIAERQAAVSAWTGQPAFALTLAPVWVGDTAIGEVLGTEADAATAAGILQVTGGRFPGTADEVLVTPAWIHNGLPASGTVSVVDGEGVEVAYRIVGTAQVRLDAVVGLVGLPDPDAPDVSFLLTGDTVIGWEDALDLAQHGFATTSRGIAADPPDGWPELSDSGELAYGGILGTGALLEVALIVGPAFAIGAARQRRSLALAASNGASVRQLHRLALGQAVLLGSTATAAGVALGVGVGVVAWQFLSSDPTDLHGPLEVPRFVAVVLVLGVLTAVGSALVPTRGLGRLDLVAALRGSARSAPPMRRARWWGLVLLMVGLAGTVASYALLDPLSGQLSFLGWFAALVVAVVGVLLVLPSLLNGLGRLTGSASVVPRMALRDLGRQRGRATATVAAILGGSVLLGVMWTAVVSIAADIEREYIPRFPHGQGEAWAEVGFTEGMVQAIASVDPTLRTAVVGESYGWALSETDNIAEVMALRPGCGTDIFDGEFPLECASLGSDDRTIFVAGLDELVWLFDLDPAQQAALREGRMLVDTSPPNHPMRWGVNELIDGRLRLAYQTFDGVAFQTHSFDVPALAVGSELIDQGASSGRFGAVATTEIAARHHLAVTDERLRVVDPAGPITPELEQRVSAAIDDTNGWLRVERGFQERTDPLIWALTGTLALLAVIAAAMATILATAEQRPFLATFAAIGASPWLSRWLATVQAAILALIGTLIGFGIGVLAGIPMALSSTRSVVGSVLVIPWQFGLGLIVAVPALAALVAAICVPARPSLVRRAG